VERDPDLYDALELAIPAAKMTAQPKSTDTAKKRQTQVSEATYRKQVNRILKQSRYSDDYYDDWNSTPGYVEDLGNILGTGMEFLDAGDPEGALIILRVLLEKLTEDYDGEMDYNGDMACVIQDIGMPLAEAILSVDLDPGAHDELQKTMHNIRDNLDDMIEAEDELELILAALEHGWDELPGEEAEWKEYDDEEYSQGDEEEYWMALDQLKQARLNVLARQGDNKAFLEMAAKTDVKRYTLRLIELGQVDEAVRASEKLNNTSDAFVVAQKLREVGRLNDAIALAERGLELKGYYTDQLALWLAPLEESQGRNEMALLAYRTAYDEAPGIEIYRHIKRLAGKKWETIQPALLQKAGERHSQDVLADIHLEEKDWDKAIKIAEQDRWSFRLLEKVADAVIPYRPDWVIRVSLKQSDGLIVQTQSKLYPIAARWLERAKKAYHQKGQDGEWRTYIDNLRTTYARRPALQREIQGL
jgi:tetratricopeptide (TPR) repeat protein